MGNLEGQIQLVCRFSSRNASSLVFSTGDKGYTFDNLGSDPGINSIVWFQWWCSRRTLKLSLVKMVSNPWIYSSRLVVEFWLSVLCQASSTRCWKLVVVAQRSAAVGSGSIHIMNKQSLGSQFLLSVLEGESLSMSSSRSKGGGLPLYKLEMQSSTFLYQFCSLYRARPPLQYGGQHVISTLPVSQLIFGLWSFS